MPLRTHLTVIFALPMSPLVENLMPSLVTEIATVSPIPPRSLKGRIKTQLSRRVVPIAGFVCNSHLCGRAEAIGLAMAEVKSLEWWHSRRCSNSMHFFLWQ